MTDKFDVILDNGEEINVSYLPNKKKVYVSNFLLLNLIALFFCAFMSLAMFVSDGETEPLDAIYALIPIGLLILSNLVCWAFVSLYLKKAIFAITNKRIIIRSGIIGVDFKSLDLKSIGATEVYVSVIDKMLGGKTGSIRFGSMSSPINSTNNVAYSFSNIVDPYKTYKFIKEQIEIAKNGQN